MRLPANGIAREVAMGTALAALSSVSFVDIDTTAAMTNYSALAGRPGATSGWRPLQ